MIFLNKISGSQRKLDLTLQSQRGNLLPSNQTDSWQVPFYLSGWLLILGLVAGQGSVAHTAPKRHVIRVKIHPSTFQHNVLYLDTGKSLFHTLLLLICFYAPVKYPCHFVPPGEETVGNTLETDPGGPHVQGKMPLFSPILSSYLESSLNSELVERAWNILAKPASPH